MSLKPFFRPVDLSRRPHRDCGRRRLGISALTGASTTLDPAQVAVVERGTMRRSVVATGRVEPITKVEIKSKANGIIEKLYVDVDQLVQPGQVLAELDRENLTAPLRQACANLQGAEAAHQAADAQLKKNEIEALSPDVEFARRNSVRAQRSSIRSWSRRRASMRPETRSSRR